MLTVASVTPVTLTGIVTATRRLSMLCAHCYTCFTPSLFTSRGTARFYDCNNRHRELNRSAAGRRRGETQFCRHLPVLVALLQMYKVESAAVWASRNGSRARLNRAARRVTFERAPLDVTLIGYFHFALLHRRLFPVVSLAL